MWLIFPWIFQQTINIYTVEYTMGPGGDIIRYFQLDSNHQTYKGRKAQQL
jgi:hypothetical protein